MAQISSRVTRPRNCTFEQHDWDIVSRCWLPVAVASEVIDKPRAARLLDVDIVLSSTRQGDRRSRPVSASRHLLGRGGVTDEQLVCPYHGLHFADSGRATFNPSQPCVRILDRLSLNVMPSI